MSDEHLPPSGNPYAPPKAELKQSQIINKNNPKWTQNGYTFNQHLVVNEDFKSPLICAKLGFSIPNKTEGHVTSITLLKQSSTPNWIYNGIIILGFLSAILCTLYTQSGYGVFLILAPLPVVAILQRLTSTSEYIQLYLSKQFIRHQRRQIVIAVMMPLLGIATGIIINFLILAYCSVLILIILSANWAYHLNKFKVISRRSGYYFIRGIHEDILITLPKLPR